MATTPVRSSAKSGLRKGTKTATSHRPSASCTGSSNSSTNPGIA